MPCCSVNVARAARYMTADSPSVRITLPCTVLVQVDLAEPRYRRAGVVLPSQSPPIAAFPLSLTEHARCPSLRRRRSGLRTPKSRMPVSLAQSLYERVGFGEILLPLSVYLFVGGLFCPDETWALHPEAAVCGSRDEAQAGKLPPCLPT